MEFLAADIVVSIIITVLSLIIGGFSGVSLLYGVLIFLGCFLSIAVLIVLFFGVVSLCIPKNGKVTGNRPFYRWLLHKTVHFAFIFLRVNYTVKGSEILLPEDKRFLVVANHLNESDPLFLLLALTHKRPVGVIAKKDLWNWFFVPNAITGIGSLAIDRENDREAAKTIISASKLIAEDKLSIGVFPEGYTEKGRGLLPFRDGVFKIAQRGKAPIVVSVIRGSEVFFKDLFRKRINIEIEFLEVIPEETVMALKTHELGDIIHKKMEESLAKNTK